MPPQLEFPPPDEMGGGNGTVGCWSCIENGEGCLSQGLRAGPFPPGPPAVAEEESGGAMVMVNPCAASWPSEVAFKERMAQQANEQCSWLGIATQGICGRGRSRRVQVGSEGKSLMVPHALSHGMCAVCGKAIPKPFL